ncbi:unnamed protein product, partial [Mesorhabditis belari]|uniref:Uncharacterized protein n=1 Tax=Mesorhabditis belari TaxID=2138241 RepID=A0AAF3EYP7_9BILA
MKTRLFLWSQTFTFFVILYCFAPISAQIPVQQLQPAQCIREIREDVCPQREGFDGDCEEKCLRDHPLRIASGCYLRNTGTLLSFFGIRSFICRCELPASFCDPSLAGVDPMRRAFSLRAIQEHSLIRGLPERTICHPDTSLICANSFSPNDCGWGRPTGQWYLATPKSAQLPFAPGEAPNGPYLIGSQGTGGDGRLVLETCGGLCSKGEVKMGLRVWRPPWVTAELCFRDNDSLLCAPILIINGKPVNEVLPQTDRFMVMIRFSNMSNSDVIFVDDVRLEFSACDLPRLSRTEIQIPRAFPPQREPREDGDEHGGQMISGTSSRDQDPRKRAFGESRICVGGECPSVPEDRESLLDRTCIGRSAPYKCQAKCRTPEDDGSQARCIKQKEYPFSRRCVCEPRRSPQAHLPAEEEEEEEDNSEKMEHLIHRQVIDESGEIPQETEDQFELNKIVDNEEGEKQNSETWPVPHLITPEDVCVEEGDIGCQHYCNLHSVNGTGICSAAPQPFCRCVTCTNSVCDFEKGRVCGWTDLHLVSTQFNNISIASKKDNDNRYALTRMQPKSYSGLIRKGLTDGPIMLTVDVFPSEELQVRICVDSLSRCQNQMVSGRAWNRVTARIKVTRTDKIFLLFNNSDVNLKTVAIDNISIQISPCVVNISNLNLEPKHYNGSWFVVARKAPIGRDYLPANSTSSLLRLLVNDEGNLNMTEYHSINGTCMPPLHGFWRRQANGYLMEMRTETGQLLQLEVRAIFHELSGENNEEMNMVLYGCRVRDSSGDCQPGEQLISILSNSRHPQTLQLFKSAKHIEDFACTDILQLHKMDTYTDCGKKMQIFNNISCRHAKIWENDEYVDVECRVENLEQSGVSITKFFDEPRMLTVIAYIDPILENEQIAHVSCLYDSKTHAKCHWLRQRSCFPADLIQEFEGDKKLKIASRFTKVNGSEVEIDLSGMVVWQNGDEYITMQCLLVSSVDGSCDQHRVYVWSDEDLMDQPTIREIYRALQNVCVDPTELIFLNTFHECTDQPKNIIETPEIECGPLPNWSPLNTSLLHGVWYVAADLNADPKIFLQSAVFEFIPKEENSNEISLRYYVQKESDRECVGPGEGHIRLLPNGTLSISISYIYRQVPKYRNKLNFTQQILYLDNQRAVLYWCFKRASNGTCLQYDIDVLIRSRFFSYNDFTLIQPYLQKACVPYNRLRWFDLHSSCGYEMSASTKLRRDMVTLSHSEVLDILTNVQEPQCEVRKIKGQRAPLQTLEKGGTWFLMAQFDQMSRDTYAAVFRLHTIEEKTAVVRMHQSAAIPGEDRQCFERIIAVKEHNVDNDYSYELRFDAAKKNSTSFIFRFLFFNRNVAVLYSCLNYKEDGHCKENAVYVISRHESIDHAELTVLEKVAKTVCIDPAKLFHTATHDVCVYEHYRVLLPPQCASVVETPKTEFVRLTDFSYKSDYAKLHLYAVASSLQNEYPFSLIYKKENIFTKITEIDGSCVISDVEVFVLPTNRHLFRIGNDTVLVDPVARQDEVILKKAQLSSTNLPCLHTIDYQKTTCSAVTPPKCQSSPPLSAAEGLLGEWLLFASDPYIVANSRCKVTNDPNNDDVHIFTCSTESWKFECERVVVSRFTVDAWGGYKFESDVPAIHENFEIFPKGNVSLTPNRLLFFRDEPLLGRSWSVWVRPEFSLPSSSISPSEPSFNIPHELNEFCVWPTYPQISTMDFLC